jgi:hypothetical protein
MTRRRRTPTISTRTFAFDERIIREGHEIDGHDPILDLNPNYFVPVVLTQLHPHRFETVEVQA